MKRAELSPITDEEHIVSYTDEMQISDLHKGSARKWQILGSALGLPDPKHHDSSIGPLYLISSWTGTYFVAWPFLLPKCLAHLPACIQTWLLLHKVAPTPNKTPGTQSPFQSTYFLSCYIPVGVLTVFPIINHRPLEGSLYMYMGDNQHYVDLNTCTKWFDRSKSC